MKPIPYADFLRESLKKRNKIIRLSKRLSYAEVGRRLGISRQRVRAIVCGVTA